MLTLNKRQRAAVRRNLTKARDLIVAGWAKGSLHEMKKDKDGKVLHSYCLIGAVRTADGLGEADAMDLVRDTIADLYPDRVKHANSAEGRIYWFNDNQKTRKSQVLRVLDKALAKVQEPAVDSAE